MIRLGLQWPRGVAHVTLAQVAALVPPFLVVAIGDPGRQLELVATALVAALFWEGLFAVVRKRGASLHGVTTALVVAVAVSSEVALWQVAMAVSLGVVLSELVFGGRGFGFLNPATVALALLLISFPEASLITSDRELALAVLPGALLLLALGLISGRVLLATLLAVIVVQAAAGQGVALEATVTGLVFGLVFLIADPTSSASTNPGRWFYGALAGVLVGLFSGGAIALEAVVFAALVAGVFAPLIDHVVVLAHAWRRQRRQHV